MRIGDRVIYDDVEYTVEIDYGNDVYAIANDEAFVDCASRAMLRYVEFSKERMYHILYRGQVYHGQYELTTTEGWLCFFVFGEDDYLYFPHAEVTVMEDYFV